MYVIKYELKDIKGCLTKLTNIKNDTKISSPRHATPLSFEYDRMFIQVLNAIINHFFYQLINLSMIVWNASWMEII